MKVLHITDAHEFSGGVKQLKLLMEGLRAGGSVEQALIVPPGGRVADAFESAGFKVHRIKMFQDYDVPAAWRIAGVIKAFQPDVVHAHHPKAHALTLVARVFTPFKFVASRRVTHPVKPFPTSRWKYGSSLINRFVAVSGAVKEELVKAGVRPERITVIGSSTDMERFKPGPANLAILKDLGTPPVVGVIANYSSWKGHDLFLEALSLLRKNYTGPVPTVYIAGRDTDGPAILAQAQRFGVKDSVRFLGWREDIPELLRATSVLVCPSLSGEGSSGSIREAFATGVSVIASDIAANRELVEEGRGGMFKSGSAADLASALKNYLESSAEKQRERESRAMSFVRDHFSAQSMVRKTLELYRELAASPAAAR